MIELDNGNFSKEVLESESPVLVDFFAEWCGPCKMLRPILEEVSSEYDACKFASVNIDLEEELSSRYEIYSIPCLILFKNGKEIKRNIGLISKEDVLKFIGED